MSGETKHKIIYEAHNCFNTSDIPTLFREKLLQCENNYNPLYSYINLLNSPSRKKKHGDIWWYILVGTGEKLEVPNDYSYIYHAKTNKNLEILVWNLY